MIIFFVEALQAQAVHENMVKVGGYIMGEFGNLIAGDPRSSPAVQLRLLHSKYHLCSVSTRALLLSTYVKFVNLFPEIKSHVQVRMKSLHDDLRTNPIICLLWSGNFYCRLQYQISRCGAAAESIRVLGSV